MTKFDRRSVKPSTLDMRTRDFHYKYGGTEADVHTLPQIRTHRDVEVLLTINNYLNTASD